MTAGSFSSYPRTDAIVGRLHDTAWGRSGMGAPSGMCLNEDMIGLRRSNVRLEPEGEALR